MLHRRLVIAIAASTLVLAGVASSAGTPAPSFLPAKIYPAGRDVRAVAVGDLDGDGKPDLATANHDSDSVSVLLNAGRGSFRTRRDYLVAASPLSVAVADLNADGKLDVVTASSSAAAVSVLLNKGNGTFEPRRNYPTGDEPFAVAVGDLDGDGDPDLVTANYDFPGHVSVLLNNGDGSFADNRDFVTGDAPESIVVRRSERRRQPGRGDRGQRRSVNPPERRRRNSPVAARHLDGSKPVLDRGRRPERRREAGPRDRELRVGQHLRPPQPWRRTVWRTRLPNRPGSRSPSRSATSMAIGGWTSRS